MLHVVADVHDLARLEPDGLESAIALDGELDAIVEGVKRLEERIGVKAVTASARRRSELHEGVASLGGTLWDQYSAAVVPQEGELICVVGYWHFGPPSSGRCSRPQIRQEGLYRPADGGPRVVTG